MDSTDDDFGELYIDAKSQASHTFARDVGLVKSCEESECATNSDKNRGFEGTLKPDSEGEMEKSGEVAKDSSPCVDACAVNLTEANEESEYSDSDDDLNIVLKDDDSKAFHVARKPNTNNGGYASANSVKASENCSFQRRRTGNWCKMPDTGMVNRRMMMDASATNNACIDPSLGMSQCGYNFSHTWSRTNLDVFEKKPWRNPGADISDFFNYGFNEQSWKDYCKPLGRAFEVEGGILERIPSADLRLPRVLDPDVVIQIPMTNDIEELASMTPVKARSISITSNEASRIDDSHSNNEKDLNSVSDSMKDEAFVGCKDDNTERINGEQSPPAENCCSKEVTPCDEEMIEEEKENTFCNSDEADSFSVERESSLGDRICLSPTSSCSVGKNEKSEDYETETSKDSTTDDQRQVTTPPRRARLAEHEAINIKSRERSGTKHYIHGRSHGDLSKRHSRRDDTAENGRINHKVGKDASPTPDPDLGKKVFSRHGSLYRDSNKNWQNEGKDFLPSNREKCHGRSYTSLDHARHREHRFGWRNNIKESSWGRGFDHSNSYKSEARLKEHSSRSSVSHNQRNSRSSFKEEDDQYGRHQCERKYGHESDRVLAYESNKEINRCDWPREPFSQDCIPITDRDYRYQFEYSSAHGIHNTKQSHENDLHCRRSGDYDYLIHRYDDGVHREESRIPFERSYREMYSFAEVGRREFQGYTRWEEYSEIDKRNRYTPEWNFDRFVSEKDGYKYRTQGDWPLPSLLLRDSCYTKEARDYSWRDDIRDFTTTEAYDSHDNHLYKAAPRDDWTWNPWHSNNVRVQDRLSYDDDWVRTDIRRYEMVDEIHCSVREVTHSEHPSYTDDILVRDIRIPTRNRMATKQRSAYFKGHICESDEIHHRSKKLRGDGHAFIECQDPVDLTGTQKKRSNQSKKRFFNGEDTKKQGNCQKPRKFSRISAEEAVVQIRDLNDREEGEIIEEGRKVKDVEIDNKRIQESMKKMEKRGERFKDSKLARTVEATFESQSEVRAKTDVTNQHRPIRKRRWCAS